MCNPRCVRREWFIIARQEWNTGEIRGWNINNRGRQLRVTSPGAVRNLRPMPWEESRAQDYRQLDSCGGNGDRGISRKNVRVLLCGRRRRKRRIHPFAGTWAGTRRPRHNKDSGQSRLTLLPHSLPYQLAHQFRQFRSNNLQRNSGDLAGEAGNELKRVRTQTYLRHLIVTLEELPHEWNSPFG